MNSQALLLGLLFAGFFAVACIRASVPAASDHRMKLGDVLRLPGRLERLRRSRWQWFFMVLLLLAFRLQQTVPLAIELSVAIQFLVFLALPARAQVPAPG